MTRSEYNEKVKEKMNEFKENVGWLERLWGRGDRFDKWNEMAKEAVLKEYSSNQNVTYNNQFNMQGQPLEQSVSAAQNIINGEVGQNQLSSSYTMMSTVPA